MKWGKRLAIMKGALIYDNFSEKIKFTSNNKFIQLVAGNINYIENNYIMLSLLN